MDKQCRPIPGGIMFKALRDQGCIIMATNIRIAQGIAEGIFQAAKDADAALIVELAKSECDLEGGYTGFTPGLFSQTMQAVAAKIGFDIWALHADHITIKKGTDEEIAAAKRLIATQIGAGYTSYAIDASFLFDESAGDLEAQLAKNIAVTQQLAAFIAAESPLADYGLEVEVGEIGKKNEVGMVVTTPDEAITFVRNLNKLGIEPHVLAIANGSTHGYTHDSKGHRIEQVSIDINQTKEIVKALRAMASGVRIAQHGITGTPRAFIVRDFPHGDIIKGNVGTFWMDLAWKVLQVYEPRLMKRMQAWVTETYREEATKKGLTNQEQIFDKYSKYAIKEFFNDLYALRPETEAAMQADAYAEALRFFEAFKAYGSASKVRDLLQ